MGTGGSKNHLSGGAIAGIVVGTIGGAILIPLVIFLFIRRRKRPKEYELASPTLEDSEMREHHTIDPFGVTPRNRGTLVTPFIMDNEQSGGDARRETGRKGGLPVLPTNEISSTIYHGDEKVTSVHEGSTSGYDASDPAVPSGSSQAPVISSERSSAGRQADNPRPESSSMHAEEQDRANPVDLQRLFEDRAFEGQLLQFIARRMDPPRRTGSPAFSEEEDSPPTYRPA